MTQTTKNQSADEIPTQWVCPECGDDCEWTMSQAAEGGTPVCAECDCDMELADEQSEHYTRLEVPDQEHAHPDCGCRLVRDNDTGAVELHQCKLHEHAPDLLAALEALVDMHNGKCGSCSCPVAPEGYCGCAPLADSVEHERRCRARAALARVRG